MAEREMVALLDAAEARLATAEKALEPFAKEAHNWSPEENDGKVFDNQLFLGGTAITIGDLRRAREALASLSTNAVREGDDA